MPRPILLDTDTGVDDALALCLAMRSPELRILALTAVHGNVPVHVAAANIQRTLDVLGVAEPPPVALGAADPLVGEPTYADEVHGWDGLGGATRLTDSQGHPLYPDSPRPLDPRPAVSLIHETISQSEFPPILIAVGPLTNVAHAIQTAPETMRRVEQIVVMGGCFRRQGNASPVAEFNIFTDPHAAQVVFDFDVPTTIIPLDVTEQVVLSRKVVESHANHRRGRFVRDITAQYMDFGERVERINGCFVHDALAVAYVFRPKLFRTVERYVAVETEGRVARGQTVADLREPPRFVREANARIAVEVDARAVLDLLISRVLREIP